MRLKRLRSFLAIALLLLFWSAGAAGKNLFLLISDGASFGAWDMTDLYLYGKTASSPYFGPEFKKYLMTTSPLHLGTSPTGGAAREIRYDPASAWDTTPVSGGSGGYPYYFRAYRYLRQDAPDSGSSATAMATGQKTYIAAINWANDPPGSGAPLSPTIAELAKEQGYLVGAVTTVPWSHATVACFSNARSPSRFHYPQIARQMLEGSTMDLLMGAGHPQFDDQGREITPDYREVSERAARYVGGRETWRQLVEGSHPGGWRLIQTRAEFEALARQAPKPLPPRLVGLAQVATTLKQRRRGSHAAEKVDETPVTAQVPSLLTLTQGAVHFLRARSVSLGTPGFFLLIEAGAVDWAAHANQTARLIEEQRDFNAAAGWVIQWIEAHGGWQDNLLLITTDHGNALPLGKDSHLIPFARITFEDVKGIPTVRWHADHHTQELVPLFARGVGAERLQALVVGHDPFFARYYPDWAAAGFDGSYLDNTAVFQVLKAALFPAGKTPERQSSEGFQALGGFFRIRP